MRVLENGELKEGDRLELVERKYPKWTLHTIGDKLYGQAGALPKDWAKWGGTLDELVELSNIEEFGMLEWREDVEELRAQATITWCVGCYRASSWKSVKSIGDVGHVQGGVGTGFGPRIWETVGLTGGGWDMLLGCRS